MSKSLPQLIGRTFILWVCPDPGCDHYATDAGENPDKGGCPDPTHSHQNAKLKRVTVKAVFPGTKPPVVDKKVRMWP